MSQPDVVWYGRAAVWIGVTLLLLMAFTGGQIGVVTVLAVVSTLAGIILLIYAIPFGSPSIWRAGNETQYRGEAVCRVNTTEAGDAPE